MFGDHFVDDLACAVAPPEASCRSLGVARARPIGHELDQSLPDGTTRRSDSAGDEPQGGVGRCGTLTPEQLQYGLVMEAAELVTDAIRRLRGVKDRPIVVALDGRSGAGKSTLATAVAETVDAAIVHVDDFYRDMPEADRLELSPARGVDRYFDWERLRAEALTPLVWRAEAQFRRFDWVVGRGLTGAVTVEPREIVIVEGVYSARPELDDFLDLKVLVEVAHEEREQRRHRRARTVSRDDPDGWDARWDAAERLYFDAIRPPSSFDLIVSGNA